MTSHTTLSQDTFLADLGDGLILRRATPADADALAAFNGRIHARPEVEVLSEPVMTWTRDLLTRPHPTFAPGDFTVVIDTKTGEIVSTLNLISQTWSYGGIPFGVGRPEIVGTDAQYRRRSLVRRQFEVIHRWSAERGELVQAITGIPNYYRMFGYEMGLDLSGGRFGFAPHVPRLKEDQTEPYRFRPATVDDLAFIAEVYAHTSQRYPVACVRDAAIWRYELDGRSEKNAHYRVLSIIETPEGEPVGYLAHPSILWDTGLYATAYELKPGISWLAVTPSVIRYLEATGKAYAERERTDDKPKTFDAWGFSLGASHPVYEVAKDRLPRVREPYAWYVRVPDLPGFIRHIAPVLERRLAESLLTGHSGELKLNFYKSGLRLAFEQGRLTTAEVWQPPSSVEGDAAFPDLTFLQVVFGRRSPEALHHIFADCWYEDEARTLLNALFPVQPSDVWPVA